MTLVARLYREPRRCTYCGKLIPDDQHVEAEHIYGQAWWSSASPKDEYKPQVPSCHGCNHAFGLLEDRQRQRWALSLPTDNHPARAGIADAALHSMNPNSDPSKPKKMAFKRKAGEHIIRKFAVIDPAEAGSALGKMLGPPMVFTLPDGQRKIGYPGMRVQMDDAVAFGRKLVRGLMRYHFDLVIPQDRAIDVNLHPDAKREVVRQMFDQLRAGFANPKGPKGHHLECEIGAGSLRWGVFALDNPLAGSIWFFEIWGHIPMTAICVEKEIATAAERIRL
jgi:hypothetical protein